MKRKQLRDNHNEVQRYEPSMKFFSKSFFLQLTVILAVLLFIQSCGDGPTRTSREPDFSTVPDPYNLSEADTSFTKEGGVKIYVIEKGVCPGVDEENEHFCEVVSRDEITLYLTGRTSEGEIFRSTYANGNTQPALIRNLTPVPKQGPQGSISPQIEGVRRGLLGMREGEKRVIIVPPELGYDDTQPPPRGVNIDLRGKELRYDVELENIGQ